MLSFELQFHSSTKPALPLRSQSNVDVRAQRCLTGGTAARKGVAKRRHFAAAERRSAKERHSLAPRASSNRKHRHCGPSRFHYVIELPRPSTPVSAPRPLEHAVKKRIRYVLLPRSVGQVQRKLQHAREVVPQRGAHPLRRATDC
jgi:hypothetical protein